MRSSGHTLLPTGQSALLACCGGVFLRGASHWAAILAGGGNQGAAARPERSGLRADCDRAGRRQKRLRFWSRAAVAGRKTPAAGRS